MIGKIISHYKIIEKLGEGGMGEVYLAEDIKLKRQVALKFLPKEFSRNPEAKKRFMTEARSSSILDHNNICVIHEISETDDGQLFISMNYCQGETLQNYIKEKNPTLKQILKYITQIAKGLEKAHNKGIVHCDIKPTNIIITDDGVVKIVDFGIARIASQEKLISPDRTTGTIAYMSPEQISNSNIDNRTDIWSLGVIFYEILTNQMPFQDSYDQAVMYSIINEKPKAITAINPDIPNELEQIINKMLNKNPDDRFQHVSDLLLDLKNYKRNQDLPVIPLKFLNSILNHKNKIWFYLLSLFLSIAVISIIVYFAIIRTPYVPSIGILNMENLGDSKDDFWSRGITEDLIINVASAGVIRVPTIDEVNKYKRSEFSMAEIAAKLRVDYLLFSSFFKADSMFDLWCRIIDPKSGKDIFAKKWSKPIKNASSITTILAGTVLNNLGVSSKITMQPVIIDPDAYEYYLKGKNAWEKKKNTNDIDLARELLNKALEIDPTFNQAKIQLGQIFSGIADYNKANDIFNECLENAKDKNDERKIALAMFNLGNVKLLQYKIKETLEYYDVALDIARKYDDKYIELRILQNIGVSYYLEGEFSLAEQYFSDSRNASKMIGDIQSEGEALNNLGGIYLEERNYITAMDAYTESYNIFKKIENKSQMLNSLIGISYSSMGLGKIDSALNYAESSLQAAKDISDKRNEISSLSYIGEINYSIGNYETALNIFLNVSKLAAKIGDTYYSGVSFQYLGQLMHKNGQQDKSFMYFELADSVWKELEDLTHSVWTTSAWSVAALQHGDISTAVNKLLETESTLKETKPYEDYAVCVYYDLYKYHLIEKDTTLALEYIKYANNEINDRLKFISDSDDKRVYLKRIIKYSEIVDLYKKYFTNKQKGEQHG